jgi:hypothetical protein
MLHGKFQSDSDDFDQTARESLCANIDETTSSSFITVEGKEEDQDGRSWKTAREPAAG